MCYRNLLLVFLACGFLGTQGHADDIVWPGWLGRNRDGWVADFQPPTLWPEKLQQVWQVDVGEGYGTPLLTNQRVYQHTRQGGEEVLWCLDRNSGEVIWRKEYNVAFKMGGGGEKHGKGPKSNPIIAQGRVFTLSITGVLRAFDAQTGDLIWQRDDTAQFGKNHPYWGVSTSPIVDGDRIIVHFGNDKTGVLVALNTATGEQVWTHGKDGPDYSSPLVATLHGVRQVIEWNQRVITGIEIETGKKLWEHLLPHVGRNQNMPTPAIHDGHILVGAENRGFFSFYPQPKAGTWSVQEKWHQEKVALNMSSAVINDGKLFGFSHYDSGRIFCLNPQTGDVLWKGPGRVGENVAFLSLPGHIAALTNSGELQVIKAVDAGYEKVASYRVSDNQTWAAPVLFNGGLLIKDKSNLTMWSLK